MPIFIANENGDWWEHRPGSKLYILNTDNIDNKIKEILEDEWFYSDGEFNCDGVEDAIQEYGVPVAEETLLPQLPTTVWYTEEELEAEVDEIVQAEREEAYDETIEEVAAELNMSKERLRNNDAVTEVIYSYVDDNLTYEQMINKVYSRMSHPSAQGETF